MSRDHRINEIFIELVNKQLEPFGKTYQDVSGNPAWYMQYVTTVEAESEFVNWGVELLTSRLGMSQKQAQNEMSWFILQWGLTTHQTVQPEQVVEQIKKHAK